MDYFEFVLMEHVLYFTCCFVGQCHFSEYGMHFSDATGQIDFKCGNDMLLYIDEANVC